MRQHGNRGAVEHGIARDSGQDMDAQACTATGSRDRLAEKESGRDCHTAGGSSPCRDDGDGS